jgi:hypothetical protein
MRRSLSPSLINPTPIPTMKKAVVILYVLLAFQTCCVAFGFMVSYAVSVKTMNLTIVEASKGIGEKMIQICDQRYVQK